MADQVQWHLSGDYFENCNCSVVCPCLVSKAAPLTSRPTEGVCNVSADFPYRKRHVWRHRARWPQCCARNSYARADGRWELDGGSLH